MFKGTVCQGYPDIIKVCLKGLFVQDIQILLRFPLKGLKEKQFRFIQ